MQKGRSSSKKKQFKKTILKPISEMPELVILKNSRYYIDPNKQINYGQDIIISKDSQNDCMSQCCNIF